MADDEDRDAGPDGHPHDAPGSEEEIHAKSWDYTILAVLVVVILVLIATGVVPLFSF